jgi:hypothetical protein
MKKRLMFIAALAVAAVAVAVPAYGFNGTPGQKTPVSTTLDACGYFVGTQTANKTTTSGATSTEKGTWTGVLNNYTLTPVASLGSVKGSYTETTTTDSATGTTTGTETFRSSAGQITQSFSYGPLVTGGFSVTVTATGDLSFLTSDTAGGCYTGPFPRP